MSITQTDEGNSLFRVMKKEFVFRFKYWKISLKATDQP